MSNPRDNLCKVPSFKLSPVARAMQAGAFGLLAAGFVHAAEPAGPQPGHAKGSLPAVTVEADGGADGSAASGYRVRASGIAGFSEQDLLDTPLSVKVLPAELLANQKIESIAGLDRLDASVSSSEAAPGWYSSPTIRGFTLDNTSNFRYNGQTIVNLQATALENKERVEILKGPSALQAGFSAPGGIINYVTKRPSAEAITDVHLSTNQYGNYKVHSDLSRRSEDGRVGIRLNAAAENERSYVRSVDGRRSFVSLATDWRIAPDTQLELNLEHERRNQNGQPSLERDVNGNLPSGFDPRTFLGQRWARYPTESIIVSGKLQHVINNAWSVAMDANWMKVQRDQNQIWSIADLQPNGDGTAYLYYAPDQTNRPANLRFKVNGAFQTGFISHKLDFGIQAQDFKTRYGGDFWGSIGDTNIYRPARFPDPRESVTPSVLASHTKEQGLFVNDAISFNDAWTLHLGGRYADRDQRTYDTVTGEETLRYRKKVFAPSAAVVFKPTRDVSTYLSYVEGLENGGEAPLGSTNARALLAPLVSKQWEAGIKANLTSALTAEAALFRIEKPAVLAPTGN